MARSSLAGRAVFVLILMVLFYAFAASVVAGLVWAGIKVFGTLGSIRGRGVIFMGALGFLCFAAACVIVWSVLPRWDKFEAPGPEVKAEDHPELFVEIRRIAKVTGQREPRHVYLVPEVNAFVAQRGGIMGIGSSRVMGIGLPLLRTLQVDELRAVLAHEMGHFYGGDTKLGPWIYKTRGALIRTVVNLQKAAHSTAEESGFFALLFAAIQAPFRWFLLGYLRVSQAISRAQEYSADAVAVRAEGRRALIDGLKKSHAAGLAHTLFMRNEVVPLLEAGRLPDVGEGFSRYLKGERLSKLLGDVVEAELADGKQDPYDSHPPMRERIAAAERIEEGTHTPDARPAIELVRDAGALETKDLEGRVDRHLEAIAWDDTAEVWEQTWREDVEKLADHIGEVPVDGFPTSPKDIYPYARAVMSPHYADQLGDDQLISWWIHVVGSAITVILLDEGYTPRTLPGEPFDLTKDGVTIVPFEEVRKVLHNETTAEAWTARVTELGIADRELV